MPLFDIKVVLFLSLILKIEASFFTTTKKLTIFLFLIDLILLNLLILTIFLKLNFLRMNLEINMKQIQNIYLEIQK